MLRFPTKILIAFLICPCVLQSPPPPSDPELSNHFVRSSDYAIFFPFPYYMFCLRSTHSPQHIGLFNTLGLSSLSGCHKISHRYEKHPRQRCALYSHPLHERNWKAYWSLSNGKQVFFFSLIAQDVHNWGSLRSTKEYSRPIEFVFSLSFFVPVYSFL